MKAASFSRTVVDSAPERVHLPIGEYVSDAHANAQKRSCSHAGVPPNRFHAEIVVSGGGES